MFTFTTGSGVRLAAILLRVLGEGVANALLGPFGALGVLNLKCTKNHDEHMPSTHHTELENNISNVDGHISSCVQFSTTDTHCPFRDPFSF